MYGKRWKEAFSFPTLNIERYFSLLLIPSLFANFPYCEVKSKQKEISSHNNGHRGNRYMSVRTNKAREEERNWNLPIETFSNNMLLPLLLSVSLRLIVTEPTQQFFCRVQCFLLLFSFSFWECNNENDRIGGYRDEMKSRVKFFRIFHAFISNSLFLLVCSVPISWVLKYFLHLVWPACASEQVCCWSSNRGNAASRTFFMCSFWRIFVFDECKKYSAFGTNKFLGWNWDEHNAQPTHNPMLASLLSIPSFIYSYVSSTLAYYKSKRDYELGCSLISLKVLSRCFHSTLLSRWASWITSCAFIWVPSIFLK